MRKRSIILDLSALSHAFSIEGSPWVVGVWPGLLGERSPSLWELCNQGILSYKCRYSNFFTLCKNGLHVIEGTGAAVFSWTGREGLNVMVRTQTHTAEHFREAARLWNANSYEQLMTIKITITIWICVILSLCSPHHPANGAPLPSSPLVEWRMAWCLSSWVVGHLDG